MRPGEVRGLRRLGYLPFVPGTATVSAVEVERAAMMYRHAPSGPWGVHMEVAR